MPTRFRPVRSRFLALALIFVPGLQGCATLQELAALRQVEFSLDRVSGVALAGVEISRIRSFEELSLTDVARLTTALARQEAPLSMVIHVAARNPEGNRQARVTGLEWQLFLQDRETVSGGLPESIAIPTGSTGDIPLEIRLDLLDFFQGNARDLVNLALALGGQEAPATTLRLQAIPTVETPFGPLRYPEPITIARHSAGG
ncbi:MAG: LEA type 2 family protein [Gemmatimonadota bacterium]